MKTVSVLGHKIGIELRLDDIDRLIDGLLGASIYDVGVRSRGREGGPQKADKRNKVECIRNIKWGCKKTEIFADVIYGCPLT